MRLLLDTHILLWIAGRESKLKPVQRAAIANAENQLFVSAAAAFELAHLQAVGRVAITDSLSLIQSAIGFEIADLPADCWTIVAGLPMIHRDPIDRMQIAHALIGDFTLVTADRDIRRYPVPTI